MDSRAKILAAVKAGQPAPAGGLPGLEAFAGAPSGSREDFCRLVETLGGRIVPVREPAEIQHWVRTNYPDGQQVVATDPSFYVSSLPDWREGDGRQLQEVELAIVAAAFGVAENGALWLTEEALQVRVLPFIAQHLAVVLRAGDIVPTMHQAYDRIGAQDTGFGVFIAGPSKTADIEQSLVLGAHGAKSLTVFLME